VSGRDIVPFVLGFAMKWRGDGSTEAVFVGAAMVATSVGITARVLAIRVLSTYSAKIILGAAVFDDILGMVLLALVAGLVSPEGMNDPSRCAVAEAGAFAVFMILWLRTLSAGSSLGWRSFPRRTLR
jgi:Kef-type K+ transport system membrane component KefB